MSEMAPERPAARRENVFTRRIGPLPMWVWLLIVGGGILAWSLYKKRTAGATSATGTDASQVPQFVNQTFVNPVPPVVNPPPGPKPPITKGFPGPHPRHHGHPNIPGGEGSPGGPNIPGGPEFRTERLRHKGNLMQIARRNNIDLEDLLEANPELKKYQGTGKMLPVGTVVRIPSGE